MGVGRVAHEEEAALLALCLKAREFRRNDPADMDDDDAFGLRRNAGEHVIDADRQCFPVCIREHRDAARVGHGGGRREERVVRDDHLRAFDIERAEDDLDGRSAATDGYGVLPSAAGGERFFEGLAVLAERERSASQAGFNQREGLFDVVFAEDDRGGGYSHGFPFARDTAGHHLPAGLPEDDARARRKSGTQQGVKET